MTDDFIWPLNQPQVVSRMTRLPTVLLPAGFSLAGGLPGWAVARKRLAAVVAVLCQLPFQVVQAPKKLGDLLA